MTRQYEVQEALVNYVESIISHPGVSGLRLRTPGETGMSGPETVKRFERTLETLESLFLLANIVTTSKAPVTTSVAPVTTSVALGVRKLYEASIT